MIVIAKQPVAMVKKPVSRLLTETLEQFKRKKHVEKLKSQITSTSLPSDSGDLLTFLHKQITSFSF